MNAVLRRAMRYLRRRYSDSFSRQNPKPDVPPATTLPDIVSFSIIDWEFRYQRPQQILSQFAARGHRVFYISTSRFLSNTQSPRFQLVPIKENVYEVRLAATRMPDIYREVADGAVAESLLQSLQELRQAYAIQDALSYVMIPSWGMVALEARKSWNWQILYDCMDEWENFPLISNSLPKMEKTLVQECDCLVVTAQRLLEKWKGHGRNALLARNAADYDFFAEHMTAGDLLPGIQHPVIGYYGAIADWFDIDLATKMAAERPQYTFVFVGGVFDVNVAALKALPNVRLEGQQPYPLMPVYLHHFDVCVIPFRVNSITEATDPVKVYEYFAGGKPIVSVDLPELRIYSERLYLARDRESFVSLLDVAVREDDSVRRQARIEIARTNTWKARYEAIMKELSRGAR